jgi:hypothetical protein
LKSHFPNLDVMIPPTATTYAVMKDVYDVLYTLEQLSLKTNSHTLHQEYSKIEDIIKILMNRQYVARLVSTLGPQLGNTEMKRDGSETRLQTRWDLFIFTLRNLSTKSNTKLSPIILILDEIRERLGGNKTRRKRHIQTNKTMKRRYVTKTSHRKKTKNANRSKTRRKRNY